MTYHNQKWVELSGMPLEQGKGFGWLKSIHPEDRKRIESRWRQAVSNGESYRDGYRYLRPDGSLVWMVANATVEKDSEGYVIGYLCMSTDVTPLKEMELKMHQQQYHAAHMGRVSVANEMASGIANELNQPLTAIIQQIGGCLLLAGQQNVSEKICQVLRSIEKQAHRAGEVIHHLKGFLRKGESKKVEVSLPSLLAATFQLMRSALLDVEIVDRIDMQQGAWLVFVDKVQLEQVLINLIQNALDSMSGLSRSDRKLYFDAAYEGDMVCLSVTDTGPGIDTKVIDDLFNPFVSTKKNGMGMGVGLSISRSIIEEHGGRLLVECVKNKGACFKVCLLRRKMTRVK